MITRCKIEEDSESESSESLEEYHSFQFYLSHYQNVQNNIQNNKNLENNKNNQNEEQKENNQNEQNNPKIHQSPEIPKEINLRKEFNEIIIHSNSLTFSEEEARLQKESQKAQKKSKKKNQQTIGDVSIQTFFLIGLLSQHVSVHFSVEHSREVDAAYPHLHVINLGNDIVYFDDYLKTIFVNNYSPKELILTTNNYIQDAVGLFGYTFSTEVNELFDRIDSIERDEIPYLYYERIVAIGTELHNFFYDCTNEIVLDSSSEVIRDLFD